MIEFKRVLVPTDFSEPSQAALAYARELPFAADGELILMHTIEPTIYPTYQVIRQDNYLSMENQVKRTCQGHLDELAKTVEGPTVRTVLREGHGPSSIVGAAIDEEADLVVIATHGRSGIPHLLMGSTAERVIRRAPCPVLTVRRSA